MAKTRGVGRQVALGLIAGLLAAPAAPAQEAAGRPIVGLVLSGGAAKGIAHVGALRVIESAGIPVDVVSGTSMGSVVGGLYAMGYGVDQLESLVQEQDWPSLFTDAVVRSQRTPEQRYQDEGPLVYLPIVDGKPTLPSGLVGGQKVFDMLSRLTWPVSDVHDFRQLPRPFAAVVVDAGTGEPVRLESGNLPLAIRASMSIPSAFRPVDIEGRTYVDGGLARNLPAEDAVALGADVLVCVDVSDTVSEDADDAPSQSFIDVLFNAAGYQSLRDLEAQRELCDVLIEPDQADLSRLAFDRSAEWIERGRAAAEAKRPELDALAARLGHPPLGSPPPPEARKIRVETIEVRGVDERGERLVRSRLQLELPVSLGAAEVDQAVARVFATGHFDFLTYGIEPGASAADGHPVARLVIEAVPAKNDRLGFGFRFDTPYDAALLFSASLANRLTFGSTTHLEVRLGEQTQFLVSYFTRLGLEAALSAGGSAEYTSVPIPIFADSDRPLASGSLDLYSVRIHGGPVLLNNIITGIGPRVAHSRAIPEVGPDVLMTASWTYGSLAAFATGDTRDRTDFPTRGYRGLARAEWSPSIGAEFAQFSADVEAWVPITEHVSVGARVAATHASGDDIPVDQFSFMGGPIVPVLYEGRFFPLHGVEQLEMASLASQLGVATIQLQIGSSLFARALVNAGRVADAWAFEGTDFRTGFAASLGLATPAGPVQVIVGGARLDETPEITFALGRSF